MIGWIKDKLKTTSALGSFSLKDAEKLVIILTVTILTGSGIDLSAQELNHYTDVGAPEKHGQSIAFMTLAVLIEYFRRKAVDGVTESEQEPEPQPLRSAKRKK